MSSKRKQFTKLHNDVLEALSETELSGPAFRIVLRLSRLTHGFDRSRMKLSLRKLREACRLPKRTFRRAWSELLERNIIEVHEERKGPRPGTYGIQGNPSEWVPNMAPTIGATCGTYYRPNMAPTRVPNMAPTPRAKNGQETSEPCGVAAGPTEQRTEKILTENINRPPISPKGGQGVVFDFDFNEDLFEKFFSGVRKGLRKKVLGGAPLSKRDKEALALFVAQFSEWPVVRTAHLCLKDAVRETMDDQALRMSMGRELIAYPVTAAIKRARLKLLTTQAGRERLEKLEGTA